MVTEKFAEMAIDFVEASSAFAEKAMDEINAGRAMQKRASDLAPGLISTLLKTATIQPNEQAEVEAMLGQHDTTLVLLKNAAEELAATRQELAEARSELDKLRGQKIASRLGEPVDDPERPASRSTTKAAEYDSLQDNYIGRRTGQLKASDIALRRVLESPTV